MNFIYGKNDMKTRERGEENCYLLTNGLGGFSSLTMIGSAARNDHSLFMACVKPPNNRINMISCMSEMLEIDGHTYTISSQSYVNHTKNEEGFPYLTSFAVSPLPVWLYHVNGVAVKKELVMEYGQNTIALRYSVKNDTNACVSLSLTPHMQFIPKGSMLSTNQGFLLNLDKCSITSNLNTLYYQTNGRVDPCQTSYENDYYYAYDARDGRGAVGVCATNHKIVFQIETGQESECLLLYTMEEEVAGSITPTSLAAAVSARFYQEKKRLNELVKLADLKEELAITLVRSADQFIVDRASVGGRTIIAGYPFFEDWGRDTMIALVGCCISTKRYEDAENILRTFMKYEKDGLMPNIFPEGGNDPAYNTVDAALLFICAVYDFYLETGNLSFIEEAYITMKHIIHCYKNGTDFHIHMEEGGLISAGSGFDQVTWMDVRIGDILPTPRHGKPVEINAYWYHTLKVMELFATQLNLLQDASSYSLLAEKVRTSFRALFLYPEEGCLKDVDNNNQIRCNQIWAVSLPFGMLTQEEELKVVQKVTAELYTPYGLRSLSPKDSQFHPKYGGAQLQRDLAYHQGTVWTFPLGGYYLAYLKAHNNSERAVSYVEEMLRTLEPCLREGCIGQLAEIYDGGNPTISHGCFAQAWSVGEILRVYRKIEKIKVTGKDV